METVINLIPSNYEGDPRKALAYCWQDYSTKTPGKDVVVDISNGVDWKAEAKAAMKALGIKEAFVHCMWGGKLEGTFKIESDEETEESTILAGDGMVETAAVVASDERIENAVISDRNQSHPGWCDKCQSHCYGDCEANEQ